MIDEVKGLLERQQADLNSFVKTAGGQLNSLKEAVESNDYRAMVRMDDLEAQLRKPFGSDNLKDGGGHSQSIGSLLVTSENFGRFREAGGVGKMRYKVQGSILPETKAITTGTLGDHGTTNASGIVAVPRRRLRIRNVLPSRNITQGSAQQYLRQLASTGGASPQVEAGLKSEASLNFDLETAVYRTIAVWTSASRQVLDDEQEMQSVIDRELMYLLESEVENQLLAGDGTGQNLSGLITQATAYDTSRDVAGDTHIDTLSHAITQLEERDFEPSFIVLHPRDRESMRLLKTEEGASNQGSYIFGNPASRDSSTVWSTPTVVTKAISQGTFLVGDANRGALILDRMESTIDISEHHDDYFARNLVAIRAECRLALIVFREDALVFGSF